MTQTLDRPPLRPRAAPPAAPVWGPGLVAASWSACAGLIAVALPVLLVWATDSRSGAGAAAAMATAGQVWLVAHGAGLTLPGSQFGFVPLGLVAVPVLLLARAAGHAARAARPEGLGPATQLALAVAAPYTAMVMAVASVTATAQVRPDLTRTLAGASIVSLAGAGWGVLRAGALPAATRWAPDWLARLTRSVLLAVSLLLAAGAILAGSALALHLGQATELARASGPGLVGSLGLLAAGLFAVPNAAVWAASWLAGPGFAVGVGTAVGPFGTHLGPVPALPLLAGLPSGPPAAGWAGCALLVPVLAGLVAGWWGSPAGEGAHGLTWGAVLRAAAVGPAAGVLLAALAAASGGPMGTGRLAAVGPSAWRVGLAVTVEVGAGAVAGALSAGRLRRR